MTNFLISNQRFFEWLVESEHALPPCGLLDLRFFCHRLQFDEPEFLAGFKRSR